MTRGSMLTASSRISSNSPAAGVFSLPGPSPQSCPPIPFPTLLCPHSFLPGLIGIPFKGPHVPVFKWPGKVTAKRITAVTVQQTFSVKARNKYFKLCGLHSYCRNSTTLSSWCERSLDKAPLGMTVCQYNNLQHWWGLGLVPGHGLWFGLVYGSEEQEELEP